MSQSAQQRRSRFPGFGLKLTHWGGLYIVASLILSFAAINTGNNALMATLGLVLASFALSGSWSRGVLGSTEVLVQAPPEIYAGTPANFEFEIVNGHRFLPAYGLVIRDAHGQVIHTEASLAPGASRTVVATAIFDHRGWTSLEHWRLEVLLPLGFFAKSKAIARDQKILVLPRLLPFSHTRAVDSLGIIRSERFHDRGREGAVTQLREFTDGDELRQIHWKQTARQGQFITMERQHQLRSSLLFVVDTRVEDIGDRRQLERFEILISEVATAIVERMQDGAAITLVMPGLHIGPVSTRRDLPLLLEALAEARALPMTAPDPELQMEAVS